MNKESDKLYVLRVIGIIIAVIISMLCMVFAFYQPEPQYVKNEKGENYVDANGNLDVYYKDLFGHTYRLINGKREYCAVPYMRDTRTYDSNGHLITTTEPTSAEADSTEPSEDNNL